MEDFLVNVVRAIMAIGAFIFSGFVALMALMYSINILFSF